MAELLPLFYLTPYFLILGVLTAIPAIVTPPNEHETTSLRALLRAL